MNFEKMRVVLETRNDTWWTCSVSQQDVLWEAKDVFNPAAIVKDGMVHLLYRAEDHVGRFAGTSRIGLAISSDGLNFDRRLGHPVLYPDNDEMRRFEWEGGVEDPRVVVTEDGLFVMTYTAYDGTARLCIATSRDLVHWIKHGPAFGGAYKDVWTKSGSIVTKLQADGSLAAVRIRGMFWMYWGEHHIHAATSEDLIHWTPVMDARTEPERKNYNGRPDWKGKMSDVRMPAVVLSPRAGKFDSELVEPGPPALLREDGILLIYNSKNRWCEGKSAGRCDHGENDPELQPGAYSAGQVLLDKEDPTQVLDRTDKPFFQPSEPFELTGQVGNVCFLEALVFLRGKWLLYYGTADSKIAVAKSNTPSLKWPQKLGQLAEF